MKSLLLLSGLGALSLLAEIINFKKYLLPIIWLGLIATAVCAGLDWNTNKVYFSSMMAFDNFAVSFTVLISVIALVWFLMSKNYFEEETSVTDHAAIILFTIAGAVVMTSFSNLSMLFIGLEILSISLYVLAASNKKDRKSNEAGFKYFIMGSFASGFLLFGIALVYGATGTFNLLEIRSAVAAMGNTIPGFFYVGVILILLALLFKVSAAPFHFWTPDVYDGAPTTITTFMATIVKTAAFAAIYRLFSTAFVSLDYVWVNIVIVLAGLTLAVGNITAVYQTSVKRMLAYSSIAHAGYMLLALAALTSTSSGSILYYSSAYSFATITAFIVLIVVFKAKNSYDFSAFNGLAKTNPFLAFVMTISMMSLAGIPPFAGFFAKYFIFTTAISSDMVLIVLVAVIASLIGVYYYFKVIIAMYFAKADTSTSITVDGIYKALLIVCLAITLALGLFPSFLSNLL